MADGKINPKIRIDKSNDELINQINLSFPPIIGVSRYKIEYYERGYIYNGGWTLAYPIQELPSDKVLDTFQEKIYKETILEPNCILNLCDGKEYVFRYFGYMFNEDGSIIELMSKDSEPILINYDNYKEDSKEDDSKEESKMEEIVKNRKYTIKLYEIEETKDKMDKIKVFKYGVETVFIVSSFIRIAFTLSNHFTN
jgi:hypothetical protein